ncbi:ABC transporter ATP-binding protein [Leptodesmis sichuanensis]|uniref:ABC transporter ATP-binding protein n=1 Tax=Leptodesmis sichuanensis TaxID=2906798 RepID=UPI001F224DA2|nr:ABC transporter ATP-binding protein [Leptodesmis sichuanensis A121]
MTASQINIATYAESPEPSVIVTAERSLSSVGVWEWATKQAVVARDISMVFRSEADVFPVLKNINLDIAQGDIQLLMGPSGSGKTTLLSILAGILTPTSGSVHLLGQEITTLSKEALAKFRLHNLGFIFQGFNLFPALTASENVEVALRMKGIHGREMRRQARKLLAQVGLADRVDYLPRDLSGGQKQRVAIARALAGDPKLIMADEPTASLDSHSGHAVIALLRQLAKEGGRTVLIVTHDPRLIDVADHVAYLEDGMLSSEEIGIRS